MAIREALTDGGADGRVPCRQLLSDTRRFFLRRDLDCLDLSRPGGSLGDHRFLADSQEARLAFLIGRRQPDSRTDDGVLRAGCGQLQVGDAQAGRDHAAQTLGRRIQAAHGNQSQREHDDHARHHDHALHHVGPHYRMKATVGGVEDHGHGESQQAEQVGRVDPLGQAQSLGYFGDAQHRAAEERDVQEEGLEDQAARLELGDQIHRHEEDDHDGAQQSESRALEPVAKDVGDGDGPRPAGDLIDPFSQQAHPADGHHDVAADPEPQDPAVGVDLGGEAGEAPSGRAGGGEGEGEGPDPQTPAPQEVLGEEALGLAQTVGHPGQEQDAQGVDEEGDQGRVRSVGGGGHQVGQDAASV